MTDTIKKRPAAVAAFVKASMEGWKSYLQDPGAGNALISKANPQMGAEQIAFGIAQMKKYQLVTGGDAMTDGIGIITRPRLKKTWDMLVKNKLIDASKVPLSRPIPWIWSKMPESCHEYRSQTYRHERQPLRSGARDAGHRSARQRRFTATAPGRCCPSI